MIVSNNSLSINKEEVSDYTFHADIGTSISRYKPKKRRIKEEFKIVVLSLLCCGKCTSDMTLSMVHVRRERQVMVSAQVWPSWRQEHREEFGRCLLIPKSRFPRPVRLRTRPVRHVQSQRVFFCGTEALSGVHSARHSCRYCEKVVAEEKTPKPSPASTGQLITPRFQVKAIYFVLFVRLVSIRTYQQCLQPQKRETVPKRFVF